MRDHCFSIWCAAAGGGRAVRFPEGVYDAAILHRIRPFPTAAAQRPARAPSLIREEGMQIPTNIVPHPSARPSTPLDAGADYVLAEPFVSDETRRCPALRVWGLDSQSTYNLSRLTTLLRRKLRSIGLGGTDLSAEELGYYCGISHRAPLYLAIPGVFHLFQPVIPFGSVEGETPQAAAEAPLLC